MPTRRTTPQRRSTRCTYREGSRRCPYDGDGAPVLCRPHRIALAEASRPKSPMETLVGSLSDLLSGRSSDTDAAVAAAAGLFDQWWSGWNATPPFAGSPRYSRSPGASRSRAQPREPSPEDAERISIRMARHVMGFSHDEPLTEAAIKERKRQLAKRHHPDRGGSDEMMARVNDAADILLASM